MIEICINYGLNVKFLNEFSVNFHEFSLDTIVNINLYECKHNCSTVHTIINLFIYQGWGNIFDLIFCLDQYFYEFMISGFNEELFNAEYGYDDVSDPNSLNFDPNLDLYGWQPEVG